MKAEIKIVSLVIAGILGMEANLALAIPVTDKQGDYPVPPVGARGNRHVHWLVVDSDSQGLNCRMAQRFRSFYVNAHNMPYELFARNKHNVSQWPILTTFQRGERLRAVNGNLNNQMTIADIQGKPWLPIVTKQGHCFVRANSRFVKPIREDPTTSEPLE